MLRSEKIDVSQVCLSGVIVTDAFKQTQLSAVEAGDLWGVIPVELVEAVEKLSRVALLGATHNLGHLSGA
jgi:hypothetical protein